MTLETHPDVIWEEVDEPAAPLSRDDVRLDDQKPSLPPAFICHCWRCRRTEVFLPDAARLDRILARHLLRQNSFERESWLQSWSQNPYHLDGVSVIRTWMQIERGQQKQEPVYR